MTDQSEIERRVDNVREVISQAERINTIRRSRISGNAIGLKELERDVVATLRKATSKLDELVDLI